MLCIEISKSVLGGARQGIRLSGDQRSRKLTRPPVQGEYLGNGGRMRLRRGREHSFNCIWDSGERDAMLEEGLDRHLVGRIECDAVSAPLFGCFVGQAQAGKALKIRLFEVQVAQGRKVEGEMR